MIHLSVRPFIAACGANEPNQLTTPHPEATDCEHCDAMRERIEAAVAGEREALAQLIDRVGKMFAETQLEVSAAIRARGGR